ncbi:MAG: translation initiation factor IF-2 [Gammaproteobacteria bacterium]|nr:MAG: translation initiation factor IF-2 [Gammaproteobacteria bacterium]
MSDVTVTEFAVVLKIPVDRLLVQLNEAGIDASSADDTISDDSKLELLTHLRRSHGRKDPGATVPRKITLNRKSQSELRLPGGQGRSRTVSVEIRRKATYVNRDVLEERARKEQEEIDTQRETEAARLVAEQQEAKEQKRRAESEASEAEVRRLAEKETQRQAAEDAHRQAEEKHRQAEDATRERAEQAKQKQTEQTRKPLKIPVADHTLHVAKGASARRRKRRPRRRPVQVSVDSQHGFERPTEPVIKEVEIPETITVNDLAQRMAIKSNDVIKVLMNMGMMVTINQVIDQDTAVLVVEELGHTALPLLETGLEDQLLKSIEEATTELDSSARSPVVTVMGHVDHGKTSLLDYIRQTHVASGEAGGITQHIGAYHVTTKKGSVTFLDTPGHAAFTAMRARGALATDIVILVVAADDGVMPQTVEAIEHAKAAGVALVVAVNKTDLEASDPDRVRKELTTHEVVPEDWGGETLFVNVSAKTGDGVDALLDAVLLQAEVLDLKAISSGPAAGVVLEASLERGRGAVATVLVKRGMLKVGDILLAGQEFGRIRAMFDDTGAPIDSAGPSIPAAVLGLSGTPMAGDDMLVVADERKAREVARFRQSKERDIKLAQQRSTKLDDVFSQMSERDSASVQLLIKADVQGSSEALRDAVENISTDEVKVTVISRGVGAITESDIQLAVAAKANVIGFNVRADSAARQAINETGISVRYYSIIYEAIDDVKAAVSGLLAPEIREQILGLAEVREIFRSPKFGNVAGCIISDGYVRRTKPIRVLRDNVVIYEGELESLRRFKDDVNEVRAGTECGIGIKNYNDVKIGDQIECYDRTEIARSL